MCFRYVIIISPWRDPSFEYLKSNLNLIVPYLVEIGPVVRSEEDLLSMY